MTAISDTKLQDALRVFAERFDQSLKRLVVPSDHVPERLRLAVEYAALAPGKRLRPFLAFQAANLCGGTYDDVETVAAAIECIHAFSLTHDDLPAMDDDDLRRGQLSCHKKFGEATGILAGDALAVFPFELITSGAYEPATAVALVNELAEATGWIGMIGGQAADLEGEKQAPDAEIVEYIQLRKTARLIEASCRLGAIAAGGTESQQEHLAVFGRNLGMAFQIADDLLDVTAESEALGKATGKDHAAGKQTLVACIGLEEARQAAVRYSEVATESLAALDGPSEMLAALSRFVVNRTY
ncbi:MAG: polyprenyl synthetase family protein [Phycisphaerae bacterium]